MDQEERRRKLELNARFNQRITVAKVARNAFKAKNYVNAVKQYTEYLNILCHAKEVEDIFSLTPEDFDDTTAVSEILLISHVYWDLSRMYETNPKFKEMYSKSINQFVKFSANQPFQVLNAEMVRKYIKKRKRNGQVTEELSALDQTYSDIYSQSKSCFIASSCFGNEDRITNILRDFKSRHLIKWPFGIDLIKTYYTVSPRIVIFIDNYSYLKKIINPALRAFAFLTQTSIFNKCSSYLKLLRNRGLNR